PRRRRKARDVPESGGYADPPRLAQQRAAPAARLPLELHGEPRSRMGVMQAVDGAIGARQSVQVGDEVREAIDAVAAPGSERGPVDALTQQRQAREPFAGPNQIDAPP